MSRPRSTARDQRREVVVGEHDLRRLLGDLGAAAHRDADVGLLERGGVVHGVAGHRDDLAGLLHEPGQAHLVLGRDPAEHVQLRQPFDHLVVGQPLQLGPGDDARAELELVGDRPGGHGVVAGDHADVDAGVERGPDRLLRLGAERVDDADQRDQHEVADRRHRVRARPSASPASSRSRTANARTRRPFSGQLLVGGEQLVAHVGDRHLLAVPERRGRTGR